MPIRRDPATWLYAAAISALLLAGCGQRAVLQPLPSDPPTPPWPPAAVSGAETGTCVATSALNSPQPLPLALELPPGELAWAHFSLQVEDGRRPWQVRVTVGAGHGGLTQGAAPPYWVGVSDYVEGRWRWSGPYTLSCSVGLDTTVLSQRYSDASGAVRVVLAALQEEEGPALGIRDLCLQYAAPELAAARARLDENLRAVELLHGGDDGEFSFAVIGDTRSGDAVYKALLGQMEQSGVDFIIHLGDFVHHGYTEEYEAYQELIDAVPLPIVPLRGNHEIASGTENFAHYIGAENWTFDYGGCRFVGVENGDGAFDDLALQTAKDAIGGNLPTFLCFHKPPPVEPWSAHAMKTDANGGRWGELEGILTQGSVRAVFMGHIHLRDEMPVDGIPFVISGAGGSPLATQYKFGVKEFGFHVVAVDHGSASWRWVPLEN